MAAPIVEELRATVTKTVGTMKSATVLIAGIKDLIAAAVQEALANGATAEELAPFTELETQLENEEKALAEGVAANQPPPPPV